MNHGAMSHGGMTFRGYADTRLRGLCGPSRERLQAVQQLKQESGNGLLTGGVTLPMALAELGWIDEYEFVVQPRIAGHGPTLFAGLSKYVDLKLVGRLEFRSGGSGDAV